MIKGIIKEINKFFEGLIDDDVWRCIILKIPFWGGVIFVLWTSLLYLGPYLILLSIPIIMIPFSISTLLLASVDETTGEKNFSVILLIGSFVVFLFLFGIPWVFSGWIIKFIVSNFFINLYVPLIGLWWDLLNIFGIDLPISSGFYFFKSLTAQLIIWGCALVLTPLYYFQDYSLIQCRVKKAEERRHQKKRELDEKRKQEELAKEAELEKRVKEAHDPDPWDSGFF